MVIPKIQAIELGWGENSIYFSTNAPKTSHQYVDNIEMKDMMLAGRVFIVYCGYRDNQLVFQMSGGGNITIYYQGQKTMQE